VDLLSDDWLPLVIALLLACVYLVLMFSCWRKR
jgi:hypothetical protein